MSRTTPQIEAILGQLTTLCCEALESEAVLDADRIEALVESLSKNGWERHSVDAPPLATILERRVLDRCREPAMHRGAAVESVTQKVQRAYDNHRRYEASSPATKDPESPQSAKNQARSPRPAG